MFTDSQLKVVKFCAEECRRQDSGELSVANMVEAWDCAAMEVEEGNWSVNLVLELGFHVEPQENKFGFRQTPVTINEQPIPWETIPRNIETLMDNQGYWFGGEVACESFYQAFQRIHPFIDGNGRVGAILYNMLLGTMDDPKTPPKYKE